MVAVDMATFPQMILPLPAPAIQPQLQILWQFRAVDYQPQVLLVRIPIR